MKEGATKFQKQKYLLNKTSLKQQVEPQGKQQCYNTGQRKKTNRGI